MNDLWTIATMSANLFAFDQSHPLVFTQFYFWAFFAFVFAGFTLISNRIWLRNAFLFFASLFFYYKTGGLFLLLLLAVLAINYVAGLLMDSAQGTLRRKAILTVSVIADLGLLAYFKYAYFFTDLVNHLLGTSFVVRDLFAAAGNAVCGTRVFDVDSIMLPVGVSFFTFQSISYVADIYRGRINAVRNLFDFGFYVSFFPQLVAGPIVRASDFVPQLHKPFNLSRRWFGLAVFWILNGLLKKLILSDYIAVNLCDRVFENPHLFTGFENLCALFGYSLQIYADFSGYTDIAIGVALLMGFYLPKNFNSPYKARSAPEFWKRWHISLSRWLQDYLYIPMGGNRNATSVTWLCIAGMTLVAVFLSGSMWVGMMLGAVILVVVLSALFIPQSRRKIVTNINALNTMLLGGLWHGASWNFVIWGGLNGLGMIVYKLWKPCSVYVRALVVGAVTLLLWVISRFDGRPVWNFLMIWCAAICLGTFIKLLFYRIEGNVFTRFCDMAWAVVQTFVFVTFTRLFFRSGSNLDPAEANEQAWQTATDMVGRIGGAWNFSIIPDIVHEYRAVLLLIVAGMAIHWLPDRFKRRYRIWFLHLPLLLMGTVAVLGVLFAYQFITADLQTFVYFQF